MRTKLFNQRISKQSDISNSSHYATRTFCSVPTKIAALSFRQEGRKCVFNLYNISSFAQWVPEISHHCPRTPFLLVGTQVDLREDSNTIEKLAKNKQRPLYPESGEKLARELKAVKYVECSALTQVWAFSANCFIC